MSPTPNRRPRRIPYTAQEVANIIEAKKRHELIRLKNFKNSITYKWQNMANMLCFFIYWELVFSFFGPANFSRHYSVAVEARYATHYNEKNKPEVTELDIHSAAGKVYTFMVNDFIDLPPKYSEFLIGRDYILQKELKGRLPESEQDYRLFLSSPVMLIIMLALITSCVAYLYNLNQNSYSLMAMTVLNLLCMFALVMI